MTYEIPESARAALEGREVASAEEIERQEIERTRAGGPAYQCVFCHGDVRATDVAVWRKVEGFERRRPQGGTNMVALRRPLDEYACDTCITRRRSGLEGQTQLDTGTDLETPA